MNWRLGSPGRNAFIFPYMRYSLTTATMALLFYACGSNDTGEDYQSEVALPGDSISAGVGNGTCFLPDEAVAEDVSVPDHVVGDGSPESCTAEAFTAAVALGGKIVFDCGADPVTIKLTAPAKVYNDADSVVVIDGGGKVALSGSGISRILYMNTCDESLHWTTPHCNNQDHPRLSVQNIDFINGNSRNENSNEGGGAIWARGGRLKIVNSRFFNNVCASQGPDVGGGAVRVFDQFNSSPVYVVNSTFGGAQGLGNVGSNGGALSSIGVSWTIVNSIFSYNEAIGNGGNPAQSGTPGGGSGGAIYNDGNYMKLSVCGSRMEHNKVQTHGGAIFFVSNDHSGSIRIESSAISDNPGGNWYPKYPGISMHDDTPVTVVDSEISE